MSEKGQEQQQQQVQQPPPQAPPPQQQPEEHKHRQHTLFLPTAKDLPILRLHLRIDDHHHAKDFARKFGNAVTFGAGATLGADAVNGVINAFK